MPGIRASAKTAVHKFEKGHPRLRRRLNKKRPRPKSGPPRWCQPLGAERCILQKHNGCEDWSGQYPALLRMLAGLSVTTLINLKTGQRAAKASAPRVFRLQAHFTIHGERTAPGGIDELKKAAVNLSE